MFNRNIFASVGPPTELVIKMSSATCIHVGIYYTHYLEHTCSWNIGKRGSPLRRKYKRIIVLTYVHLKKLQFERVGNTSTEFVCASNQYEKGCSGGKILFGDFYSYKHIQTQEHQKITPSTILTYHTNCHLYINIKRGWPYARQVSKMMIVGFNLLCVTHSNA